MTAAMISAAARAAGTTHPFRRIGFHTDAKGRGEMTCWDSAYGKSLQAQGKLHGETVAAWSSAIANWAHTHGLDVEIHHVGATPAPAPHPTQRIHLATLMDLHLRDRTLWQYAEVRPIGPKRTDCSGSTVLLYQAVGAPDPTGNHYSMEGNTEAIRHAMPHRAVKDLLTGDTIVYGRDDDYARQHVVIVREPHPTDPLVFSFGQPGGPYAYRHSVENHAHDGYFTSHGFDLT